MSEATGLSIVIEPKNALAVFTQPDHIESILQQVEKEVNSFVPDVSTKKGRDAIASLGLKVAKTKTYLDGLGKDLVTEYKEVPKKIDASRKTVRDRLSGGATGGCTLNYKDPFYKGLGEGFETVSIHIGLTYVRNMSHLLTEDRWEIKGISAQGTIYRLKPEFMPANPTPLCSTQEELVARRQECLRLLSAA